MEHFTGFRQETLDFFQNLKKNNTKRWFEDHRAEYEQHVRKPSSAFVVAMGEKLETIAPAVVAIPKINQSLFRLNKDTRFSRDKRPYKTNLGLLFWEGRRKRMECSGFYFHVEDEILLLGVGIYRFPKPLLEAYREAVVDKRHGKALRNVVTDLEKKQYSLNGRHYKRVPRGYDAEHENASLLRHNGLYAGIEMKIPAEFFSAELVDFAFGYYKDMNPLHVWLRDTLA